MPAAACRMVTALREQPHGKVAVELDGEPWRVLPADAVVGAGLGLGRPLDRERARDLARALRRARALTTATRALRQRNRTSKELADRLERAGVVASARAEALAALEGAGLVDDGRFAHARAEALARRGYGNTAIRADLARRGVHPDLVEEAVAALEPEPTRARRLLVHDGADAKHVRRLVARGFDRETLLDALRFADRD